MVDVSCSYYLFTVFCVLILVSLGSCTKDCPHICLCHGDYVDCTRRNLVSIPANLPKWTTHLNLNSNRIRKLSDSGWQNLDKLKDLKLNQNDIHVIPNDIFKDQKVLKILEINRNKLKSIEPLTFKSLGELTVLKLKRNQITQLKDGAFFGLHKIKSLFLEYNIVQTISKRWLYGLKTLKELSLHHNDVNVTEMDAWEFCRELMHLDLSYNRLKSIKKDTFKYLEFLQKLMLNNNNITFIEEGAFSHLPNLKILQLNNNKISWTIEDANGVFKGLNSLIKFHLSSNNIKSINKNAFVGLKNLNYLELSNNNITSVQKNAFAEMPLLQSLALNTTSLLCDCNIRWFYDWLMSKHFNVFTVCSYPEWLKNKPLLDVSADNFTCDELLKPRLVQEPEMEIMALKGENISLSCKAMSSSPSPMTFQWKKDNIEIVNKANVVESSTSAEGKNMESSSELNIYKVQHSDAGKYQCVVSNVFGMTYSQKSNISVLIFPTFLKIPSNVTVPTGTTARLECAAHGEPLPEIAWQKDGGNDFPAARERRMHVMYTDDVFFIVNTKPSDMGIYSCTAHNAAGTIVANASLTIEEKPSFVKPMESKDITAGESVVLQCMASGIPKPVILWLKDGEPIHATERHFFTAEDQLMIIVDTIPNDAGIYQCQLNNSLGTVTGFSQLHVKPAVIPTSDMMGIIIISVVCCAVCTSIIWVVIIYQTRRRMGPTNTVPAQADVPVFDFTDKTVSHFGDDTSEHSSCKDSGTGDSAKRSSDDLLPDEYTLIINENNVENTTKRTASLVYLVAEGNNSHVPLLHTDDPQYSPSTNHDRQTESNETDDAQIAEN